MGRKRHIPDRITRKFREAWVQLPDNQSTAEIVR
jgi:hypothetical protein